MINLDMEKRDIYSLADVGLIDRDAIWSLYLEPLAEEAAREGIRNFEEVEYILWRDGAGDIHQGRSILYGYILPDGAKSCERWTNPDEAMARGLVHFLDIKNQRKEEEENGKKTLL